MCTAPLPAPGQNSPPAPALEEASAKPEPYLDRKVGSTLEQFTRWKARMKKEHFTEYLVVYTALLGGVTGIIFGFLAYRLSDPMSTYRIIRRRTLQLSVAIGGAIGVFAAVMQVPPGTTGKVSLLFLAIGTGAAATLLGTGFSFLIMRLRSNHLARRDGRRITHRMRHA
jgi:uncharacterized membrane protein YsdA (DUF1294 family)